MALTIVQIAEQLLPKLPNIKKLSDLTDGVIATEIAKNENAALKTDYDAIGDGDKAAQLTNAAKAKFTELTTNEVKNTIKGNLNKTHEFKPNNPNAEIDLNGLIPKKITVNGVTLDVTPGTTLDTALGKITYDTNTGKLIVNVTDPTKTIKLTRVERNGADSTPTTPGATNNWF